MQRLVLALGILAVVTCIVLLPVLPYAYCVLQEETWLRATTQGELEDAIQVPHTRRAVPVAVSEWGGGHVLADGHRMIQYMLFGVEPLEVVYAADRRIVAVYTSYQ